MKILIVLLLLTSQIFSQTVYEIPFSSKGNEIELEVLNSSATGIGNVNIKSIEKPDWIIYDEEEKIISSLEANKKGYVTFKFDVDKEAKVLEESSLKFQITSNNQTWDKEIKIQILPPDKFALNQNYPNPFNPSTTISYTIPGAEAIGNSLYNVRLTIFDILGREVKMLVDAEQKPGYYKVEWNANNFASGMYIYQVSIKGVNNKSEVIRKKMMLTK